MNAVPKQVQQAAKELEEYENRLINPVAESEQASESTEQVEQVEQVEQDEQTESSAASAAPVEQSDKTDKTDKWENPEDRWEHKYHRLQGKYDAEVPRLHQELKELRQAFVALQQDKPKLSSPEEKPEPPQQTKFVTQEDEDNFGSDLLDVQRRVAREELAELRNEIATLKQTNQQFQEQFGQVRTDSFQSRLLHAVPDFAQVDNDPRWATWLDEVDPMLRGPRRRMAEYAWNNGDVDTLRAYVDMWRASIGEAGKPTRKDRSEELKKQVQPTRASAPAGATAQRGRIYTDVEARRAFDHIQKLISAGKYDEASTLEQEISAAYVEGRVQL